MCTLPSIVSTEYGVRSMLTLAALQHPRIPLSLGEAIEDGFDEILCKSFRLLELPEENIIS